MKDLEKLKVEAAVTSNPGRIIEYAAALEETLASQAVEIERLKKKNYAETVKLMTNGTDALTVREQQARESGARSMAVLFARMEKFPNSTVTLVDDAMTEWKKREDI